MINVITPQCPAAKWPPCITQLMNLSRTSKTHQNPGLAGMRPGHGSGNRFPIYSEKILCLI